MSTHVTEWLDAYLDDELHGSHLGRVQAHLTECEACRAELESLEALSGLLHDVPAPPFTPAERLAAQVRLRLPRPQSRVSPRSWLEVGWWMVPLGLFAAWVFLGTSSLVSDLLSLAHSAGLLSGAVDWMRFGAAGAADWSSALGQLGLLSGRPLELAASTEAFTRTSLPYLSLQVSIALLYLSWIVTWWARQRRQRPRSQFFEG